MQITYPITYFPSNWNILTFFYHFSIWFVSFYIILCKLSSFMRIYAFKRKNLEETLCLQPQQFVSISLHLRLYANYCSPAGFRWRQKYWFWIPKCLPFGHLFYFGYQDFKSQASDFSFQRFNAGKLKEMLQLINVTQHALRPHNLIFLLSFFLLLSPKQ